MMKTLSITMTVALMALSLTANGAGAPYHFDFEEVGPGVWAGIRADPHRYPVMGNTTFVLSDEGVVVFDGGGAAAMADQVIAKIRSLTVKPVTHVVISHWHGDHNFGVFRFAEEFPRVQFVAHSFPNEVFNSTRIAYVDRQVGFIDSNLEEFKAYIATGRDSEGNVLSASDRSDYAGIVEHADAIRSEAARNRVTPADITFTDQYTIQSGSRTIELRHLGHANTAGDIVMWLPKERIVSTGDIVVLPSPYAFNVPPRSWADTLRAVNALHYRALVPGHGEVQTDTAYVDLLVEVADSIANQRDALLAEGKNIDEVQAALDFSAFEERFTHGDKHMEGYYNAYFELTFRAAAMKALTGEPMVRIDPPESVPFDDARWRIEGETFELVDYLGQRALKLRGGMAVLPVMNIRNGLVEFDMAVSEERGFAGLVFRLQDNENYEHFYIRPHQSGNPDANQYTPVFNGISAWQLYHDNGYGSPVNYRFDEWMHVKVIFAGSQAQVYIESDEPVLHISELKRAVSGGAIGVDSSSLSAVYFANFKVTQLANAYAFPLGCISPTEIADGTVLRWAVSDKFPGSSLKGTTTLSDAQMADRSWTELSAEPTGITNLARIGELTESDDTDFARVVVSEEKSTIKMLNFGYSDAAMVFVNGRLVYHGNNGYRSRDYRYLGTIGLFDHVALPLNTGNNEVWIAVSEAFGGWGIMATITDLDGS